MNEFYDDYVDLQSEYEAELIENALKEIQSERVRDYYGTFGRLKNFFNESKNELKFFESFVKSLFRGSGYFESPVTFNFRTQMSK